MLLICLSVGRDWGGPRFPLFSQAPYALCNNGHLEIGMFFVLLCFKKSRNFWVDRKREWHLAFIARKSIFLTGGTERVPVRSLWVNNFHSVYVEVWVTLWAKWKPSHKTCIPLFTQCLGCGRKAKQVYPFFFQSLKAFPMFILWLGEILLSFFLFLRMGVNTHTSSTSCWRERPLLTTSRRANIFLGVWERDNR